MSEILDLVAEIATGQRHKLLTVGRKIRPNLTTEDILQPNDYPELENNPLFRHEEGILAGIETVHSAMRAHLMAAETAGEST